MQREIDFSKYSSIKIGQIESVRLIDSIIKLPDEYCLIGGANNLLISPTPPPLAMLSKRFDYIKIENNFLYIGAATKSGRVHSFCKKHNIKGFEYLSKLPGTMGGLIKMNAGMKEDEIFNSLYMIKTIHGYIPKEDIAHGYRFTNINDIVYEAVFEIREGFDISKVEAFSKMRKNQPKEPSAGSCFKNPPNNFAGKLLDIAGLKGFKVGDMAFCETHANFLINLGNGTFEDAIKLIELAKKKVFEKSGVMLELEIKIVG
jgi:UDP-N-acetylmuramate dehydrogenase